MGLNLGKDKLGEWGIKTYKTSVYHPSSNPAERVLREVAGFYALTVVTSNEGGMNSYLAATEEFLNLAHHQAIDITPYTAMHEGPPPREIRELINFPTHPEYQFDRIKFY